jgi:F-type H+-transporting ATPase subunit delta
MIKSRLIAKTLMDMVEKDDLDPRQVATKFIKFAEKRNLLDQLPSVLNHLVKQAEENKKSSSLVLETAREVSDELVKKLTDYVDASRGTKVEHLIDEEIIGGFRIQFAGKIYDGSLKNNLFKLRKSLISQS